MKVITKKVGEEAQVQEIENSLTKLQELVGGYFRPLKINNGLHMLVNEEGMIHQLPLNLFIKSEETKGFVGRTQAIVGDIIFAAYDKNGDMTDLNDFQMNWVWLRLKEGGHATDPKIGAYKVGVLNL